MNCAECQIVWMKGFIHLPGGTAVEFNNFGTNGLMSWDDFKIKIEFDPFKL